MNGFCKIENSLLEKFATMNLSGSEWKMIFLIIRKTMGYNKEKDWIALSQFEKYCRLNKSQSSKILLSLIRKQIICRDEDYHYTLNIEEKNKWCIDKVKGCQNRQRCQNRQSKVVNSDNLGLSKQTTTIYNITKDNIQKTNVKSEEVKSKYEDAVRLLAVWNSRNIIYHDLSLLKSPLLLRLIVNKKKTKSVDQIIQAIKNYADVLDGDSWFTYRWTLKEFLKREGADKFYPPDFKLDTYLRGKKDKEIEPQKLKLDYGV